MRGLRRGRERPAQVTAGASEGAGRVSQTQGQALVGKLDRLARDTRFLLSVLDSGVEVLFCDLPHIPGAMGRFVVTQMAAVAELEAGLISERTKAGLAVAKQRGVKLGPTGAWSRTGFTPRRRLAPRSWLLSSGSCSTVASPCVLSPLSLGSARWRRRTAANGTRISSPVSSTGSKPSRKAVPAAVTKLHFALSPRHGSPNNPRPRDAGGRWSRRSSRSRAASVDHDRS